MPTWSIAFLVVAILAGLLGFNTLAGSGMWVARLTCVLSLILFAWSVIVGRRRL